MSSQIELKPLEHLDLKYPRFNCDHILNPRMENYEMLKHLNGFRMTSVCGLPGSGKTSLVISMLTNRNVWKRVFNHVQIVMPSTSRQSLVNNPFERHSKEKMHEELDFETITHIYNELEKRSDEKETTLLILDDVTANLKVKEIQKLLRKIIFNRRHLKVAIVLLVQSYIAIPKEVRKLNDNVIMFRPSKPEFEHLFNELFTSKKDLAVQIMAYVFKEKHDYLFLNVPTQKMYKNFDEIVVKTENEL